MPVSPQAVLGYRPPSGIRDEMNDGNGLPRPAWAELASFLSDLGEGGLRPIADHVCQSVRDHGVSYNVPGDPLPAEKAWALDPIPLVLDEVEFGRLAAALAQRARLLTCVLADLYGPQRILRAGLLPAWLVLGNPTFLRPCHGLAASAALQLYAADVVRTRSGSFCLIRDRTQAPTGAGYALENRLIISRALEGPFRRNNVHRLAVFFRALRESLVALSPARENPHVVLQSSGALSPTCFEQSFLAQYLGYPLVEGGDLVVRDGRVFLKTLGGLTQVDVILRQPEDDYCDPLELRPDSQLGLPGLVQAVRTGRVAVANPLGSGLAQSAALLPFLPRIAREYFHEELLLDSAPTFWCGEPSALSHVEASLKRMLLRPAWPVRGMGLIAGNAIGPEQRAGFIAQLRAHPELFVAQEEVSSAVAPVLSAEGLVARPFVLRGYAVCSGKDYVVMPGGLALMAPAEGEKAIAVAHGAIAKDLWIRSEVPVTPLSLLPPPTLAVELSRGGTDLPSRSADNLFWLGRYAERAEFLARLGRHLLARLAAEAGAPVTLSPALALLCKFLAAACEVSPLPASKSQPIPWMAEALCSSEVPGSLSKILRSLQNAATGIRDRLSSDTFRVLARLSESASAAHGLREPISLPALTGLLDSIVTELSALSGLAMESMTRGQGWRFLDMGRRMERALQLLSLLRTSFSGGAERDGALLEALLAVADSSITYRRRYLAGYHPAAVADLLLVDDSNPRAVIFQLLTLREHLQHIPHDGRQVRLHPEDRLALSALTRLQLMDVIAACQTAGEGQDPPLLTALGEVERDLLQLSEHLCSGYLNHAVMARPLAEGSVRGPRP